MSASPRRWASWVAAEARFAILITLVAMLAACIGPSGAAPQPVPSSAATPELTPRPPLSPDELAAAVAFRISFGLRRDIQWARQVASDPFADWSLGAPLTAEEATELRAQMETSQKLVEIVNGYAAPQPGFADIRVDQERHGIVVVQFTGNVAEHEAALEELVPPGSKLEVRQVPFSRDVLQALADRVGRDTDWLRTIDAFYLGSGVDSRRNLVYVRISSADPDAEQAIIEHYDAAGKMYVDSDGTGVWLWPRGTVIVRVVDTHGRPVPNLIVNYTGDVPGTGSGDMGQATDAQGEIRLEPWAPVNYIIDVGGGGQLHGVGHAKALPNEVTTITISVR